MKIEHIISTVFGFVTVLIGGWDMALQVLTILMCLDIISGLGKAWVGELFESKKFREGLMSKAGFFVVLILAFQIDVMMGNQEPIVRTVTALYYIGVEGTSLIENLGAIGVPIPTFIKNKLKAFKDEAEKTEI